MPKDWDEGNKRIEGIFGQIGLGNQDPEKIPDLIEAYEKAMNTAEVVKGKKKHVKFEDAFNETEGNTKPEDNKIVEEEEPS
jgi:hypothetical protein